MTFLRFIFAFAVLSLGTLQGESAGRYGIEGLVPRGLVESVRQGSSDETPALPEEASFASSRTPAKPVAKISAPEIAQPENSQPEVKPSVSARWWLVGTEVGTAFLNTETAENKNAPQANASEPDEFDRASPSLSDLEWFQQTAEQTPGQGVESVDGVRAEASAHLLASVTEPDFKSMSAKAPQEPSPAKALLAKRPAPAAKNASNTEKLAYIDLDPKPPSEATVHGKLAAQADVVSPRRGLAGASASQAAPAPGAPQTGGVGGATGGALNNPAFSEALERIFKKPEAESEGEEKAESSPKP